MRSLILLHSVKYSNSILCGCINLDISLELHFYTVQAACTLIYKYAYF